MFYNHRVLVQEVWNAVCEHCMVILGMATLMLLVFKFESSSACEGSGRGMFYNHRVQMHK